VLFQVVAEVAQGHLDERAAGGFFLVSACGAALMTGAGERSILAGGSSWVCLEGVELVRRVPGQVRVEHAAQGVDQVAAPGARLADDQHVPSGLQRQVHPSPEARDMKLGDPHPAVPSRISL
jgi:hypothetical protein